MDLAKGSGELRKRTVSLACHGRDFPVVKTLPFPGRGYRFNLWLGNQDPACHTTAKKIKKKKKRRLKKSRVRGAGSA